MIPILEVSQSLLCNTSSDPLSSGEKMTKSSPSQYPSTSFPGISPSEQFSASEESIAKHTSFQIRSVELNDFVEAIQTLQGREKLETD